MTGFLALLAREIRLALRHPADTLAAVLFFVLVAALFPFGVGPAPETLARLAPGALFAAALLAALLPLDRLFGADAEDGTLDQLLLSGLPRAGIAAAKALGHWITTGLPLLAATPVAAAMLNLPVEAWGTAVAALGLATALLSLLGTVGAALTLG
ncbi:MAG TPA: heme exporter protein CcmB, partial [Roseomonas sp.]|nr:heme exporter protein CcmB [Roseomonas sp.]